MKNGLVLIAVLFVFAIWFYGKQHVEKRNDSKQSKQVSIQLQATKKRLELNYNQEVIEEQPTSATKLYQAGRLSRSCTGVPSFDSELSEWVTQAYEDNEPFEYVNDMQERFVICTTHHQTSESYIDLLLQAAEKGSDEAVSELWKIGDVEFAMQPSLYNKDPSEYTPSTLELFKAKRYQLAKAIALTGGEHSLLALIKANQHYDPETKKQNLVKSLAYAEFAINVLDSGEIYQKAFWFKERLTEQLLYEDVLKAQLITDELMENYH